MPLNLFISAGEASGEHYGALLIDAIAATTRSQRGQERSFFGMGGPRMADAGLERVVRAEDMAVMGVTEVVRHLPRIYREFRKLRQSIRDRRPDVAVLIDFPDIHFKLAEELHRLGIPVIFFVSPQLWAWKKHRIELVRKYVDRMLVIFPFEEAFYRERGIEAEFVGHPLAELPPAHPSAASSLPRKTVSTPSAPGSAAARQPPQAKSATTCPKCSRRHWRCRCRIPRPRIQPKRTNFVVPLAPTLTPRSAAGSTDWSKTAAAGWPSALVDDARAALSTPAPQSWPAERPRWKPPSSATPSWWSTGFRPSPTPWPNAW